MTAYSVLSHVFVVYRELGEAEPAENARKKGAWPVAKDTTHDRSCSSTRSKLPAERNSHSKTIQPSFRQADHLFCYVQVCFA